MVHVHICSIYYIALPSSLLIEGRHICVIQPQVTKVVKSSQVTHEVNQCGRLEEKSQMSGVWHSLVEIVKKVVIIRKGKE